MTYSAEVLADSPLAYWRQGDPSGTTMTDSSGNARHGTYSGTITLGVAGLLVGDADTCADFTGAGGNSQAAVAYAAWMDVTAFSVEAWINADSFATASRMIAERDGGVRCWQLSITTGGKIQLVFWTAAGGPFFVNGGTTLVVGTTYHVAATFDGATANVYLNGVQDGTLTQSGTLKTGGQALHIGLYFSSITNHFDGRLDEIAYYGAALSPTRLAAHYAAGVGGSDITVSGDAFVLAATALDGSALTAISIAGEVFASATTMLDGTVVGTTITGEAFATTTTMLDGSPVGAGITITGEPFVGTVTALDGSVVAGTDTSNALDGWDITFTGTAIAERPPAAVPPSLALGEKYDKAIAYPVPVMVNGRPT